MWHNVRARFDALGVTNVVWVMDYMNYSPWDCLVPTLYPGDRYVDWIMFNAYAHGPTANYSAKVGHFYGLLTKLGLTTKTWGIAEWGIYDASQEEARDYYDQARLALEQNTFPRLKAYLVFDSPGAQNYSGLRVSYSDGGDPDPAEEEHYREFAQSPKFQ